MFDGDRMRLLLHACCAQCLTYTAKELRNDFEITAFWFNPNIHPFKEYKKRLEAVRRYEKETGLDIIYLDEYELRTFLEGALRSAPRCEFCYRWRLQKTAEEAVKNGFDAFSTTLTISPYQDHEMIKKIGGEEGKERDIKFVYRDMTDGFKESHDMADEMDLYKQGYCGCIFSEKERYQKTLVD